MDEMVSTDTIKGASKLKVGGDSGSREDSQLELEVYCAPRQRSISLTMRPTARRAQTEACYLDCRKP